MGYNYNENMVNTNLGMVSIEDLKQLIYITFIMRMDTLRNLCLYAKNN